MSPLGLVGNSPHFAFIYTKTEKIVTALYLVTNFLSDSEPLKWKARSLGGELLSLANVLKDKYASQREAAVLSMESIVLELGSLLDIARNAGLMSEMNAGILRSELESLVAAVLERKDLVGSPNFLIDSSFFGDVPPPVPPQFSANEARPFSVAAVAGAADKGHRRPSPRQKAQAEAGEHVGVAEKKDSRRKDILSIVGQSESVTIKDISTVLKSVSEKTIQRELLALVGEGVLKKEGERRWSRYSIIKA